MALIIDIETAAQTALPYNSDDHTPPSNYGPDAAAKWHDKNRAAVAKAAALNPRTGRIVAIGLYNDLEPDRQLREVCHVAGSDTSEADIIGAAMQEMYANAPLVTFNGLSFDLPYLHVRAAILGLRIPYPVGAMLRRYSTTHHIDLMAILSNWDRAAKGDTLHGWCRAFGIPVADDTKGADIAAMVERGDYEGVAAHCLSDIRLTAALYTRCLTSHLF